MITLIFASNNAHKVEEIRGRLPGQYHVISLAEAGITIEIPEPHDSLEANATEKSRTILALTGQNCFSEDTGLEVEALGGEPGVKSARYAGEKSNSEENMLKLLNKLGDESNRSARFRTVISLQLENTEYLFEGICIGKIDSKKTGNSGFGYDPVFIPDGASKSFGEMNMEEKSIYSHRAKAVKALEEFLSNNSIGKTP